MASILMGTTTALIVILICGGSFYIGYRFGCINSKNAPQEEKTRAEMTEEQKRLVEGFTNILNHANRHRGGDKT